MAEPEAVDAFDGGDLFHHLEPLLRLHLGDDEVAPVGLPHLGLRIAGLIAVVGEAEGGPSSPLAGVSGRLGDGTRLLGALDHRHHHALRANIERAGDEMVFAARHPHHRHHTGSAACGGEHLQALEAETTVLHVVDGILACGVAQDLRHAGNEELEDHGAQDGLARQGALTKGLSGQGRLSVGCEVGHGARHARVPASAHRRAGLAIKGWPSPGKPVRGCRSTRTPDRRVHRNRARR